MFPELRMFREVIRDYVTKAASILLNKFVNHLQ